jgi:DNA-binding MarR family transcriptional regulator
MQDEVDGAATPADGRELGEQISKLLLLLTEAGRAQMTRACAQLGLPFSQANALLHLGTSMTMRELATKLHCDASNVTSIVDGLEGSGLAERRVVPADRRAKTLTLTRKGRTLRERYRAMSFNEIPGLSALSDAEQKTLRDLLARMLAATADRD